MVKHENKVVKIIGLLLCRIESRLSSWPYQPKSIVYPYDYYLTTASEWGCTLAIAIESGGSLTRSANHELELFCRDESNREDLRRELCALGYSWIFEQSEVRHVTVSNRLPLAMST